MKQSLTTHDISKLIQVDRTTVSKWIDRGLLVAFKTPGGHRRVQREDFKKFLVEHKMPMPPEFDSQKPVLLVVDDQPQAIAAIRRQFKPYAESVDLVTTNSGAEAMLLVSEVHPRALLIDLKMPSVNGFDVCTRIRSREALRDIRLITMSAHVTTEIKQNALRAGADAVLEKPIDPLEVLKLSNVSPNKSTFTT